MKAYTRDFRRRATEQGLLHRFAPRRYGGSEQSVDMVKAQVISEAFGRARAWGRRRRRHVDACADPP